MINKELYYNLAFIINKKMYENNYIDFLCYKYTLEELLKKGINNGLI